MGRFASKYPPEVDRAIAEAVAAKMGTSKILTKLRAGTLDGLKRPVPIPDRTFYLKLEEARVAQRDGGSARMRHNSLDAIALAERMADEGDGKDEIRAELLRNGIEEERADWWAGVAAKDAAFKRDVRSLTDEGFSSSEIAQRLGPNYPPFLATEVEEAMDLPEDVRRANAERRSEADRRPLSHAQTNGG